MSRRAPDSTHTQLMQAMGAKSFDPIPPDQYLYFLDEDETAEQRLLAWLRSKTIRGRRSGPTAYAHDERGRPASTRT